MSKVQMLRCFVNQRLAAAAQEICGLFERTIAEYEEELCSSQEENERQRKLLDAFLKPEVQKQRADVQQLLEVQEEVPLEQQDWSSSLDQEDPEPPHIKEEQEDPEPPHIEEDQEDPEPPHIKEEEEDPEPPHMEEDQGLNNEFYVSDPTCSSGEKPLGCSECGERFLTEDLRKHMKIHTRERTLSCQVCKKTFKHSGSVQRHLLTHTREKPFSCSVCEKSFRRKSRLKLHMMMHTGEKPFSCSQCGRGFTERASLKRHMTIHTGEKPFSCSVCEKTFIHRGKLKGHMITHTGEKQFSCSVCTKYYTRMEHLKRHMLTHRGENSL
ncbi:gastrula zinc finger protein XlCGF7.1-like isoform X2 [Pseudoliparis swirei]|uniref:gastrula zinc finger protein XlCGF7.1-like isoform X2 n=1 Tax=Pseudoliparis swirei TaxID=2059687 RepID=UPI0024BE7907|nr:gastrula zinc finger protein XlCGF7.1-like isoform X2 [Pseudoliparis swirei]